MNHFKNLEQLNEGQLKQYYQAISEAFPAIISESPIIKKYWSKLETYFPKHQQFLMTSEGDLIGFINAIPFQFRAPLDELPEEGWDWMFIKGIQDHENQISPNYLGGLQVIVRTQYQNLGHSKTIINHCKQRLRSSQLSNLVIPIRPTKKHLYPSIPMKDYMHIKEQEKVFDPWIRTHLKGGAEIIKTCERSMTITGNIKFWENQFDNEITISGDHILKGALRPITIDLAKDRGEYHEPNIWIKYNLEPRHES